MVELADFMELEDFAKLMEKRSNSWERIPAPWSTFIYKLSMKSMVWNISFGQLGSAAWLCSLPARVHLLVSQTWETAK